VRALVFVVALSISCTPAQAPRVHRAGEIAMIAGIGGMLIGGVAAALSSSKPVAYSEFVFAPIMIAGGAAFWISDGPNTEHDEQEAQRKLEAAFALAKTAKHAARASDCAQVQAIEPRVRELDESVYRRFRHDKVIATCLVPAGSAL
jgi:hypothetical protein